MTEQARATDPPAEDPLMDLLGVSAMNRTYEQSRLLAELLADPLTIERVLRAQAVNSVILATAVRTVSGMTKLSIDDTLTCRHALQIMVAILVDAVESNNKDQVKRAQNEIPAGLKDFLSKTTLQ